jgi:hypothetical protein
MKNDTKVTTSSFKPTVAKKEEVKEVDHEAMARDIILAISHELHVRTGIGPIWRQLNAVRKKEIIDAWTFKTMEILSK